MDITFDGTLESQLRAFYLDWFNNYLSIGCIAEHHGLDVDDVKQIIAMGRVYHARFVADLEDINRVTEALA